MRFLFASGSVSGSDDSLNRDAFYAAPTVLAVAEGLGEDGRLSARIAVEAARHFAVTGAGAGQDAGEAARAIVQRAHRDLRAPAVERGHLLFTSLTTLVLADGRLGLAHLGNTSAFMVRDGVMFQITADDRRCEFGVYEEDWEKRARAPYLPIRSLYSDGPPAPDVHLRDLRAGDRYLVCTDGLGMSLPAETIHAILTREPSPGAAVAALLALAPIPPHRDDATCVVADVR